MLLLLVLQQLQLLMLTCGIHRKLLCLFFYTMWKKYFALTNWILILECMAVDFFDSIIFLSLFPTANSMHGILYEKQSFSMQLTELNFIIYFFQLIIRLCVYSHPSPKIIVYTSNLAK